MHRTPRLAPFLSPLAALALVPLALAPAAPREELRYAPAEGLVLQKSVSSERESGLESFEATSNGQEMPGPDESTQRGSRTIVVRDHYVRVGDARPLEIVRTFETIGEENASTMSAGGEEHEWSLTGTSELEDESVRFEWDEDESEYVASAVDDELDEELLEDLEADLSFAFFLPSGSVEVDDEWTVGSEIEQLFTPTGELPMDYVDGEGEPLERDEEGEAPDEDETVEEDVTCRFAGTRDADGVQVAVIAIRGEVRRSTRSEKSESDEVSVEAVHTLESTLTIEGELLWNLAGSHLHSLTLEGESDTTMSSESHMSFGDQEMERTQEADYSGTWTFAARFEPVREEE